MTHRITSFSLLGNPHVRTKYAPVSSSLRPRSARSSARPTPRFSDLGALMGLANVIASQSHEQSEGAAKQSRIRILIIKPSSLGDVVHTLPVLRALRRRYPAAEIVWLIKSAWAPLVAGHPDLDGVIAEPFTPGGWLRAARAARAGRYDIALDLQGLLRSGMLARASGAPIRIGLSDSREGSRWFYTHRVDVSPDGHAIDRYLAAAAYLDAPVETPEFVFPPGGEGAVVEFLRRHGLSQKRPLVAIAPLARWATKRWPSERFARVAKALRDRLGAGLVLIGGPEERAELRRVAGRIEGANGDGGPAIAAKLGLRYLPALLRGVDLLITNDSGPMHVAAAVGTPVVAVFGPTDPKRTGPYGDRNRVLRADIPCSPCLSRRCGNPERLLCMRMIGEREVLSAAEELLRKGKDH